MMMFYFELIDDSIEGPKFKLYFLICQEVVTESMHLEIC